MKRWPYLAVLSLLCLSPVAFGQEIGGPTYNPANVNITGGLVGGQTSIGVRSAAATESAPLGQELTSASSPAWTSTNWTGSYATGFTHTPGHTDNLSQAISITGDNYYLDSFTITNCTAGSVNVSLGGVTSQSGGADYVTPTPPITSMIYMYGPRAVNTNGIAFIPTSDFDGTISNISVKQITGPFAASYYITGSNSTNDFEIRSSPWTGRNDFPADTYVGLNAGTYSARGNNNAGFGNGALQYNTTGWQNSAFGVGALQHNTTGAFNAAMGLGSLNLNVNGYDNAAFGADAMHSNTAGRQTACFGNQACYSNTIGYHNAGLGDHVLWSLLTGTDDVAIGYHAGLYLTGSQDVLIGSGAAPSANGDSNEIVIGYNATGNGSNTATIGNSSVTGVYMGEIPLMLGGENPQTQGGVTNGVTCDPAFGATSTIALYNNWTAIAVTINAAHLIAGQVYRYVFVQPSANAFAGTPTYVGPSIRWAGGSAPALTGTINKADIVTCLYSGSESGGLTALLCDIDWNF